MACRAVASGNWSAFALSPPRLTLWRNKSGFGVAAFARFACEGWWARQDSNLRQHRYERCVLTAELQALVPCRCEHSGQDCPATATRNSICFSFNSKRDSRWSLPLRPVFAKAIPGCFASSSCGAERVAGRRGQAPAGAGMYMQETHKTRAKSGKPKVDQFPCTVRTGWLRSTPVIRARLNCKGLATWSMGVMPPPVPCT